MAAGDGNVVTTPPLAKTTRNRNNEKLKGPYSTFWVRSPKIAKIKVLVDSGADFCMFDGELTRLLDIDLTKLEQINVSGVSGAAKGYVAHIEIGVEGQFFPTPAVFSFDFSPDEFGGLAGQLPGNVWSLLALPASWAILVVLVQPKAREPRDSSRAPAGSRRDRSIHCPSPASLAPLRLSCLRWESYLPFPFRYFFAPDGEDIDLEIHNRR